MSRTIEKRRSKISTFLVTLRQMLNNQPPQYITWGSEQNSFKIKNPSRFSEEVLPKYFKHSNLSSFIRQLNIYDFKKVSNEKYPDEYIYSHPYFDKNRPQLMKNIYRKVHHIPNKNVKSNQEDILYSSHSQENSTISQRKKLKQEVEQLQHKLAQLQSINTIICEQNLQLEGKIPLVKNANAESYKYFYKLLMQSYEVQYLKYAQRIQNQLVQQSSLLSQLYQRQRPSETPPSQQINIIPKQSHESKNKSDTNYNSTSSGGSFNGNSTKQKQNHMDGSMDRWFTKGDKIFQGQLQQQNNVKQKNGANLNREYQSAGHREFPPLHNNQRKFDSEQSSQSEYSEQIQEQYSKKNRKQKNSEQQNNSCPNRCVIDLNRKWNENPYDRSKMQKAVVLKPNGYYNKGVSYNTVLY